jgi:hypothetical protein
MRVQRNSQNERVEMKSAHCPTLECNDESGEGNIKLKDFETYYNVVFRLDVLGDWIAELQDAYDRAHKECYGSDQS